MNGDVEKGDEKEDNRPINDVEGIPIPDEEDEFWIRKGKEQTERIDEMFESKPLEFDEGEGNEKEEEQTSIYESLVNFFKTYRKNDELVYYEKIKALYPKEEERILQLDIDDLDPEVFDVFFFNPKTDTRKRRKPVAENLKTLSYAAQDVFKEMFTDVLESDLFDIETKLVAKNRDFVTPLRKVNIETVGKLVIFDATVISKSAVIPTIKARVFQCNNCFMTYPKKTKKCEDKTCESTSITLCVPLSKPTDLEYVDVQELQDEMKAGSTVPVQKALKFYGNLTGKFKPGDNIRIIGIPKLEGNLTTEKLAKLDDVSNDITGDITFEMVVEAHNVEVLGNSANSLMENPDQLLSEKDKERIRELRNMHTNDELRSILVNSFASHIYGYEMEREAVLLQAVGSVPFKIGKNVVKRKEIHILMVGDPGVTKSQILLAAKNLNLYARYSSGKGASGVGLTAGIDPDEKGMAKLKVGAVPLCNNTVLCVDEFKHITQDNQGHLLETMELGTISINKGGINVVLNAHTSLLCAANPDGGRYDSYSNLKDNIKLDEPLLSRFDIIFVILDKKDRDLDSKIFSHIARQYDPTIELDNPKSSQMLDDEMLQKYIIYAKTHNTHNIQFTRESLVVLEDFYHDLRNSEESKHAVTATPRQLEGLFRLCIAYTRLMLKRIVTEDIARHITNLITSAYRGSGFIRGDGAGMEMTAMYSQPLNKVSKPIAFDMVMRKLTDNNHKAVDRDEVVIELVNNGKWDQSEAYSYFEKMEKANKIYSPYIERTRKKWLLFDS